MAQKIDTQRLKFLMNVDEALREAEKITPNNDQVAELKAKFYALAGHEFNRNILEEIHEFTVEEILHNKAKLFYKDFPRSIKDELVAAYIMMEHHYRRDNFFGFCEQVYKQIECYTKLIFSQRILLKTIIDNRLLPAYSWNDIYKNNVNGMYEQRIPGRISRYGFPLQGVVLSYYKKKDVGFESYSAVDYDNEFRPNFSLTNNYIQNRDISVKFKAVLYCLYFNETMEDYEFNKMKVSFEEIKAMRNMVHGGSWSTYRSKSTNSMNPSELKVQESISNKYKNYLKYLGFLSDFMSKVSTSTNIIVYNLRIL